MDYNISHLKELEAESIFILREVAAQFERPVIMFSGGKDSILIVHLAYKAFYPAKIPFPLLHVDTGHNFPETLEYRDKLVKQLGAKLIVGSVEEAIQTGQAVEEKGINASRNMLQIGVLLDAIEKGKFDAAMGGARRDEEKARAKERFFSHRDEFSQWDPKNQRPELWNLFNGKKQMGEHFRIFPISNWTELDVWQYLAMEKVELPSLYFSHEREVFERDGTLLADCDYIIKKPEEKVFKETVRCRTIGDMTCTGVWKSNASTVEDIIEEVATTRMTERGGRTDDKRSETAMEDRKKEGYLESQKKIMTDNTELLRFTTAGSVDDGKSTLIGRLLYDSKSIYQDQYDQIKDATERRGEEGINLALLTDGLKSEREQGITIDVAYRYFSTPKRKFIIADTPGHIQYTRNMVTGASTANVALILIDARHGVVEQTRRHAIIASLLQIPHIVVCINKMDLVDYSQAEYDKIQESFEAFAAKLDVVDVHFIPISALLGDNVVTRSEKTSWYDGPTLMYYLINVHIASDHNFIDARFPVQFVIRPNTDEFHDYRGYAGRLAGGIMKKGDTVTLLPTGFSTKVKKIMGPDGEQSEAFPPQSVTVLLEDDLDLSRGDMIVRENNQPEITQDIEVMLCWFDSSRPLQQRGKYSIRHTTQDARCIVKEIRYKLDINSLHRDMDDKNINMNDIARVVLRSTKPLFTDSYRKNRNTGSIILIDEASNNTVAAGMII